MTIILYSLKDGLNGGLVFSFTPFNIHNYPGIYVNGGPLIPNETLPPIVIEGPEEAKLEGDVLVWNEGDQNKRAEAQDVWSYAKIGLHGFKRIS